MPEPFVHLDLWGSRQQKYAWLLAHSVSNADGVGVHPASPGYALKPREAEIDAEYLSALSLQEIFPINSLGIATARDHLAVKWSADEVWKTVRRFAKLNREEAREEFELGPDARDWKVELAQADLNGTGPSRRRIHPILYRPFDTRFTYYTGRSRGFHCMPRNEVMQHLVGGGNLGLIGARGIEVAREYDQVFCTRSLIQLHTLSLKEVNYLFPLYVHEDDIQRHLTTKETANFSDEFVKEIKAVGLVPADASIAAFHYIYAVLHSRSYRSRYEQDLKGGFARIPVTRLMPLFSALAQCGADLVALHLLEADYAFATWNKRTATSSSPFGSSRPRISGRGPSSVARGFPRFEDGRVTLNELRWFEPVCEEVWDLKIGGYQVCEKWLKDRREIELSDEDINYYRNVVAALGGTIEIMGRIEDIIGEHRGWPLPDSLRLNPGRSK